MKHAFHPLFAERDASAHCPEVLQTISVLELIQLAPQLDCWIIGDHPATAEIFGAGKASNLKAAVKWGIDVDFAACEPLGIPITNTPDILQLPQRFQHQRRRRVLDRQRSLTQ